MSQWKDEVFEKWWPLGQSLILVRGSIQTTVKAMKADTERLQQVTGGRFRFEWKQMSSIEHLFRSVGDFTLGGSVHYALPTNCDWTVLWDDNFLCTPHDTYARCLTCLQRLETFAFYSTDRNSTQLAGTHFTYRRPGGREEVIERDVYCCNQGSRWHFAQHGGPLHQEDVQRYSAKRKRDRMNEEGLMTLLERLGIQPWRESTYDFSHQCFREVDLLERPANRIFTFRQVRERAGAPPPPKEDSELAGPPYYLRGRSVEPRPDGPARLLVDGKWCGHGEEMFWVYDVRASDCREFSIRLPESSGPPLVTATCLATKEVFPIYDSRNHLASVFAGSKVEPQLRQPDECPECGATVFRAAVGFEVPADAQSPNDTSWFALALECVRCGFSRIAYDDEAA